MGRVESSIDGELTTVYRIEYRTTTRALDAKITEMIRQFDKDVRVLIAAEEI